MIAIIDYGVGNLRSVEKAFHYIGADARITSDPETVRLAAGVVLPGVGAFSDGIESLKSAGMIEAVKEAINEQKLFLGICLGMQMLFEYSEEGGNAEGLGIFKGAVRQIPAGQELKVPHMGWNSIEVSEGCPLFSGIQKRPYVYFVHSYYLKAEDRSIVAATTEYGISIDAAIGTGRTFGTQFHPEKSGRIGLDILRNWLRLL